MHLPGQAMDHDSPTPASQVAGTTTPGPTSPTAVCILIISIVPCFMDGETKMWRG
jgi:hypothetical protein